MIAAGLVYNELQAQEVTNALNRHGFVGKDSVNVVNLDKVSSEDAIHESTQSDLPDILIELGLSEREADLYAKELKQGAILIVVKTEAERVSEAKQIIDQATG